MIYLLDTNTCIRFLNPSKSTVPDRLAAVSREEVAICQIVKAELYYGAYKSARRDANLALLAKFFSQFVSLPFDDAAAEAYGRLRAGLARRGTPIGPPRGCLRTRPRRFSGTIRRGKMIALRHMLTRIDSMPTASEVSLGTPGWAAPCHRCR